MFFLISLLPLAFAKSENCFKGELTIDSDTVTIEDRQYYECDEITGNLNIPESVTSIGEYAFYGCTGLTGDLKLLDSVTNIGTMAFAHCTGFKGKLILPNNIEEIGEGVFKGCSGFTGPLTIPSSASLVGAKAFYGCTGFNGELNINSVYKIGDEAFFNCIGFTGCLSVKYQRKLGNYCFCNCKGFTSLNIVDNSYLTEIPNSTFENCTGFTGNLELPDKITIIRSLAFSGCTGFDGNLTLSKKIEVIEEKAFYGLSNLKGGLNFGPEICNIGDGAFAHCSSLNDTLKFDKLKVNELIIGNRAFYACSNLIGELEIATNITLIGDESFAYCSGFTDLTIPITLKIIGKRAFFHCTGFTGNILIPSKVKEICDEAFSGCSGFDYQLSVPNTIFGNGVFSFCTGLPSVDFTRNDVRTTVPYMFQGCSSMAKPYYFPTGFIFETHSFEGCSSFTGQLDLSKAHNIKSYAFAGCTGLTNIIFYSSTPNINYVPQYAFANCTGLNGTLTFPSYMEGMLEGCFYNCYSITKLELNDALREIHKYAFYNCSGLSGDFVINDNIKIIEEQAFGLVPFSGIVYSKTQPLKCANNAFISDLKLYLPTYYGSNEFCGIKLNKDEAPVETPTPVIVPEVSEVVTYDTEKDDTNSLNEKIQKAFENLNNKDENKNANKVVYINAEKYPFTLNLSPTEFISSEGNTKIDFQKGNLNLALNDQPKIQVDLREESDFKLKGRGDLQINPIDAAKINITNNFDINGTSKIYISGRDCGELIVDSVNLSNAAEFTIKTDSNSFQINFGDVNVAPYSNPSISSLNDIYINNELNIEQTSRLTIENVNLKNAKINMNMNNYDYTKALLVGEFPDNPKSIKLTKGDSNKSPIEEKEYAIINGDFSHTFCSYWLNVLDLGDSGFNDKYCQKVNANSRNANAYNSNNYEVLIVKAKKSKSGLGTGPIIGIVVAVIVVVVVVIVVVFIVIRRKNKNNDSTNENEDKKEDL